MKRKLSLRRALNRTAICLSVLILSSMLSACSKELSVQQQIIASLETMEEEAEEGRFIAFMEHIAEGFEGQQGALGRQDFQRFMMLQINETRRIYVNFFPINVIETPDTLGEPQATATFRLLVTGGQGLLPERGQLFDVSTNWIKQGGDWLLLSADWDATQIKE